MVKEAFDKSMTLSQKAKKKQPRDARGRYAAFSPSTPQADDSESPENEQADGSGVGTIAEQTSSTNLLANDPPLIVPVVRRDTSTQHEDMMFESGDMMFERAKKKKKKQLEKGEKVKTKYTCYVFPQFLIVRPLGFSR